MTSSFGGFAVSSSVVIGLSSSLLQALKAIIAQINAIIGFFIIIYLVFI
ncbi:hypothetical protein EJ994_11545 [Maribacter sp. MJ134]|nr:hypothetical protein EJ994_11545 [Maribacter sp. MJ134]